jgi:lipopolysaccharide export system permease protein
VLLNGSRYEGTPGQQDYRIVEFERYAMRIEASETKLKEPSPKAYTTLYLLQNQTPWNLSELHWRLGLPISAMILALLAIPLSFVNPRAGRSLNLMVALVIYMVYNNLISMGLLGLHALMLALTALWFYHRMSVYSWRRWLR